MAKNNRDNNKLAELVVRCDMERSLAARLSAEGNMDGAREAESRADELHDQMVTLARRINQAGNRDACEVARHVDLAHMDTEDARELHAEMVQTLDEADGNTSDPDYLAAVDDYHAALDDRFADMSAIYRHILHAIQTKAPWYSSWTIDDGIVREMGAAYYKGTSPLPVTNDDVMWLYEELIEDKLCA